MRVGGGPVGVTELSGRRRLHCLKNRFAFRRLFSIEAARRDDGPGGRPRAFLPNPNLVRRAKPLLPGHRANLVLGHRTNHPLATLDPEHPHYAAPFCRRSLQPRRSINRIVLVRSQTSPVVNRRLNKPAWPCRLRNQQPFHSNKNPATPESDRAVVHSVRDLLAA